MAYERMLDKKKKPSEQDIDTYIGNEAARRLAAIEQYLSGHYDLSRELRFPFGNNYGWGYKYSHKTRHLLYVFFEKGAITVTLQVGDGQAVEAILDTLLERTQKLWEGRYPCGDTGGWVHYRILEDAELEDIYRLTAIKCKPIALKKYR